MNDHSLTGQANRPRSDYSEWKSWDRAEFGSLSDLERRYFDAEMQRVDLGVKNPRVLELGFGNGKFLKYARDRGWEITGTEMDADLVETAREHGFDTRGGKSTSDLPDSTFDLVVAFDVLEHVPQDQLVELLFEIRRVCSDRGIFLARFPNGDSPFGMVNQNGDLTHITVLGSGKMRYLASVVGAHVSFIGGQAMPLRLGSFLRSAKRVASKGARWFIEVLVNKIFYPGHNIAFCSSNLVAVLIFAPLNKPVDGGLQNKASARQVSRYRAQDFT